MPSAAAEVPPFAAATAVSGRPSAPCDLINFSFPNRFFGAIAQTRSSVRTNASRMLRVGHD